MQIDVLTLIVPDATWRASNGLNMGDHMMWTWLAGDQMLGELVYIKGPSGSPWDWLIYDQSYIYLLMTENVWSNPATAKINYRNGVPRFPRWIDYSQDQPGPATVTISLTRPRTDYMIIAADGTASASDDGNVTCTFSGPYAGADIKDASGNVIIPAGNDWLHSYKWKTTTEHIRHRAPVGRYYWDSTDATGHITASSMAVGIVNKPCPAPVQKLW